MRHSLVWLSFCALLIDGAPAATPTIHPNLTFPLAFERQGDRSTERYFARGQGYVIGIEGARTTIGILPAKGRAASVVSMEFAGGAQSRPVAGPQLPGKVNYIRGNDPKQWKLGVPTYGQVTYPDVYPGVDVVYYGNQQQLEFDLVLKPGADPRAIRMKFDGARKVSIDASGQLVLETPSGAIHMPLSQVRQEPRGSSKTSIDGHYVMRGGNEVGFEIAAYDRTKPLVIDPTIQYQATFNGNHSVQSNAIALDTSGNIYLTGTTEASDFPTTAGAVQGYDAGEDGFVMKIDSSGTTLIYSTYLGGSQDDYLNGIAVDSTGAAWVTGQTNSPDFPMMNPYQGMLGGNSDAVLAKLSSSGTLLFSTFLGSSGGDYGYGVAVDTSDNAYVTGNTMSVPGIASSIFPTTPGVLLSGASGTHAFAAKFTSAGSIVYSTLLGGNSSDSAAAVAADATGSAYITGTTSSTDFTGDPGGGARPTNAGNGDAFIAKLNPSGTALLYFTFLGGSGSDSGNTIGLDASSPPNAYIGGQTNSPDLSPTAGVVGAGLSGDVDGFVAKLNGSGSAFSYITYLGGNQPDSIASLAVETSTGDVYVTGYTRSDNFPQSSPVEASQLNLTALFQTASGTSWSAFDTNIPGSVTMVAPDPVTPGTLVVSTDSGIYRTTNSGDTWTSQLSLASGITGLSRSLSNPSTIYAAGTGSVYLSSDDGVTWNDQSNPRPFISAVVADPLSSSTAYADDSSGTLYKTTDSGVTWGLLSGNGIPPNGYVYLLVAAPDGTLYANVAVVNTNGIYKSSDQGATWTVINTGLPNPLNFVAGLTVSPGTSGNVLYLSTPSALYKTTNAGASWTPTAGLPSNPSTFTALASSPNNASLVYAAAYQAPALYLSSDGGATWSAASTGLGTAAITGVVFDPSSSTGAFALASVNKAGFVAKLNSIATALVYGTYLGSSNNTQGTGIATNGLGEVFVTGYSQPDSPSGYSTFVVGITDATAACFYSIDPSAQVIQGSLQDVTYGVNAPSGCSWTALSDQPWATVVSGASGTGAGLVTVQATANNTSSTRSASLTINTGAATLTQAASSCGYSLTDNSASLSASGGPDQVNVIAAAGCPWTVVNNDPAAISVISGASGSGNGTVNFTVQPNADLHSRDLSLAIAGNYFQITQGGVCDFSLNPPSFSSTAAGGSDSVSFTAPASGCSWVGFSAANWLTITSSSSGTGNGTVSYSIAPNSGAARSGSLMIGDQGFTVNQSAAAANNRSFVSTTGSDTNNCTDAAYCRTLAAALAVTNPGGEIVVVDSGGYGPITITQPVVITAIGVDASISETLPEIAIVINTGGNVTITGLNVDGGGTGYDGISVLSVGFLRLYNMKIQSFANDGIEFTASGNLAIYDSSVTDSGHDGLLLNNASARAYAHNTSFDNNTFAGAESISGNLAIADSSAQYGQYGFYAHDGTIALNNDRALFNGTGLAADTGGTVSFASCLVSDNTTAWSVAAGGTMTDTSPGTTLIAPGQLTSGTLTSGTVLQ